MVQSDRTVSNLNYCSPLRPSFSSLPQLPRRPINAASLLCHTMPFPESAFSVLSQHQRDLHDGQTFLSLKTKIKRNLRSFPVFFSVPDTEEAQVIVWPKPPNSPSVLEFVSEEKCNESVSISRRNWSGCSGVAIFLCLKLIGLECWMGALLLLHNAEGSFGNMPSWVHLLLPIKIPIACEYLATKKAMWFKRLDASLEYMSNNPIVTLTMLYLQMWNCNSSDKKHLSF